jgi:hypothetical protein
MKLPAEHEFDTLRFGRLPLVVNEDVYWLSSDELLLSIPRSGTEPAKTIQLGEYMSLFGEKGDELFLLGERGIHVLAKAGGEPTKRFDIGTKTEPVLVGDRLVMHSYEEGKYLLHHAPLAGGEFTTLELAGAEHLLERQPAVRGDAMLLVLDWGKVVRIAGDMTKVETVYEPGADEPGKFIADVAWAGDAIVFVVGEVTDDPKLALVRQTSDGTRASLQEVSGDRATLLIGDGELAYWQAKGEGAWLVDAATIQPVDLGGWTEDLSGTSAGLAWHIGTELRLASAGPATAPELPADAFDTDSGLEGLGDGIQQITGKSTVIGPIDRHIVRRLARAHGMDVRKCSKRAPKLDADLVLSFTVGAEGQVADVAAVDGASFPDQKVLECMVGEVATWKFPEPGRGGLAKVVHTFEFNPG